MLDEAKREISAIIDRQMHNGAPLPICLQEWASGVAGMIEPIGQQAAQLQHRDRLTATWVKPQAQVGAIRPCAGNMELGA